VKVLLDSHTLIWSATNDDRLPRAVADLIDHPGTRIALSVASMWELTLKVLDGRLRLPEAPADYFEAVTAELRAEVIPIEGRHVAALAELPVLHDDPFDRMLVAQALVEDLDLVTGDERIHRYPVRTIW